MKSAFGIALSIIGLIGTASAEPKSVVLAVEKMNCALCPFTVSKAIENVNGVSSVDVDYSSKTATVTFDDAITDVDTVAAASTNAGYPASQK